MFHYNLWYFTNFFQGITLNISNIIIYVNYHLMKCILFTTNIKACIHITGHIESLLYYSIIFLKILKSHDLLLIMFKKK